MSLQSVPVSSSCTPRWKRCTCSSTPRVSSMTTGCSWFRDTQRTHRDGSTAWMTSMAGSVSCPATQSTHSTSSTWLGYAFRNTEVVVNFRGCCQICNVPFNTVLWLINQHGLLLIFPATFGLLIWPFRESFQCFCVTINVCVSSGYSIIHKHCITRLW